MSATLTLPRSIIATDAPTAPVGELARLLADATEAIEQLDLDDPRWDGVGPLLTGIVDLIRRGMGVPPSPIAMAETVTPILRLRDLARVAAHLCQRSPTTVPTDTVATCRRHVRLVHAAMEA